MCSSRSRCGRSGSRSSTATAGPGSNAATTGWSWRSKACPTASSRVRTTDSDGTPSLGFAHAGGFDLDGRLHDMALDGVVAEVIYPTFGLFIDMVPAPDLQMACAQVYNDWLAESFLAPARRVHPRRRRAGARRRVGDRRARARRAARVQGRHDPDDARRKGCPYNRPDYDPLWKIASDASMPLSLHTGTGALPQQERGPGGAVINYAKVGLLSAETLCYFAASGVLERFPGLHLVFVETGAGWFAYCCERMDEAFEEHEQWVNPKLARPPSASVKEQCHVTLGADRAPLLTREITGVGPLHVGERLPAPRRHVPRVAADRRTHLRRRARSGDDRDRERQRGRAVPGAGSCMTERRWARRRSGGPVVIRSRTRDRGPDQAGSRRPGP